MTLITQNLTPQEIFTVLKIRAKDSKQADGTFEKNCTTGAVRLGLNKQEKALLNNWVGEAARSTKRRRDFAERVAHIESFRTGIVSMAYAITEEPSGTPFSKVPPLPAHVRTLYVPTEPIARIFEAAKQTKEIANDIRIIEIPENIACICKELPKWLCTQVDESIMKHGCGDKTITLCNDLSFITQWKKAEINGEDITREIYSRLNKSFEKNEKELFLVDLYFITSPPPLLPPNLDAVHVYDELTAIYFKRKFPHLTVYCLDTLNKNQDWRLPISTFHGFCTRDFDESGYRRGTRQWYERVFKNNAALAEFRPGDRLARHA